MPHTLIITLLRDVFLFNKEELCSKLSGTLNILRIVWPTDMGVAAKPLLAVAKLQCSCEHVEASVDLVWVGQMFFHIPLGRLKNTIHQWVHR